MLKRILLGGLGAIGVLLVVAFLGLRALYGPPASPPEILDFKPVSFVPRAGEPVYFSLGGKLYYDGAGVLEARGSPIWTGQVHVAWVAPDSAHILLLAGSTLHLVAHNGAVRALLEPAGELFTHPDSLTRPYWDANSVQWSPDSRSFLVLRRWTNAVGPVALYRYRLGDAQPVELTRISHPPRDFLASDAYFTSRSGRFVYYTLARQDTDYGIYRYNAETSDDTTLRDVSKGPARPEKHPISSADVFFNFERDVLGNRDDQGAGWSWASSLDQRTHLILLRGLDIPRCTLFRYQDDRLDVLLRTRKSLHPRKSRASCGIDLSESYYLPGHRYALVRVDSPQHRGLLVLDVQGARYAIVPADLEAFFPVTSVNTAGVGVSYARPYVEVGFDRVALLPRIETLERGAPEPASK